MGICARQNKLPPFSYLERGARATQRRRDISPPVGPGCGNQSSTAYHTGCKLPGKLTDRRGAQRALRSVNTGSLLSRFCSAGFLCLSPPFPVPNALPVPSRRPLPRQTFSTLLQNSLGQVTGAVPLVRRSSVPNPNVLPSAENSVCHHDDPIPLLPPETMDIGLCLLPCHNAGGRELPTAHLICLPRRT